jgi:HPr kinase/phosphorylase
VTGEGDSTILHASCVALGLKGLLIVGPSGSGKSGLALALMAAGCMLVADDRTVVTRNGGHLFAAPPAGLEGQIEARGVGILNATHVSSTLLNLAVDLGRAETGRLPGFHEFECLGLRLPLVLGPISAHFPASVLQCLRAGRAA